MLRGPVPPPCPGMLLLPCQWRSNPEVHDPAPRQLQRCWMTPFHPCCPAARRACLPGAYAAAAAPSGRALLFSRQTMH